MPNEEKNIRKFYYVVDGSEVDTPQAGDRIMIDAAQWREGFVVTPEVGDKGGYRSMEFIITDEIDGVFYATVL